MMNKMINNIYNGILNKNDTALILVLRDWEQRKWINEYACGEFKEKLIELIIDTPILMNSVRDIDRVCKYETRKYRPGRPVFGRH